MLQCYNVTALLCITAVAQNILDTCYLLHLRHAVYQLTKQFYQKYILYHDTTNINKSEYPTTPSRAIN